MNGEFEINKPEQAPGVVTDAMLDKAVQAQRVKEGRMIIGKDASPDRVTEEEKLAVVEAARKQLKDDPAYSRRKLANYLGISAATLSQILGRKYPADDTLTILAIDRWLERRAQAGRQAMVYRVASTRVLQQMKVAAKSVMAASDAGIDSVIAVCYGDPGCGKSVAAAAVSEKEDALFITCGPDCKSCGSILGKINEQLRLPACQSIQEAFTMAVGRLRGTGKLLVVDEIHALLDSRDDSPFHLLRRLSDQTHIPQLWLATCDLVAELRFRERRREPLGQIISRIGCQFHLTAKLHPAGGSGGPEPLFTAEELMAIYDRNEMRLTGEAGRFLARLCTNPALGLLRTCTTLVAQATSLNRLKGGLLTAEMLWEAAQFLFQGNVIARLEAEMREDVESMKLKLASA